VRQVRRGCIVLERGTPTIDNHEQMKYKVRSVQRIQQEVPQ
jgi:hypothetical protein